MESNVKRTEVAIFAEECADKFSEGYLNIRNEIVDKITEYPCGKEDKACVLLRAIESYVTFVLFDTLVHINPKSRFEIKDSLLESIKIALDQDKMREKLEKENVPKDRKIWAYLSSRP
jgi:hypothetical protein